MKVDAGQLRETFRRYLRDHSLPATQQRLAVAEALFETGEHLSVEEVSRRVAKRGGPGGTAAPYRTLDLLVRSGGAREHELGAGVKRYEAVPADQPHEHCIRSSCGHAMAFSNDRLERMIALL